MKKQIASFCALALCAGLFAAEAPADAPKPPENPLGFDDTGFIEPGGKWRVHDISRPRPADVAPAENAGGAPADAVVLFDGTSTDAFVQQKDASPCNWIIENGELVVNKGSIKTREKFGACQFHVEWLIAPGTQGISQKRGNSGIFFVDGKYEIQILDTWQNPTYADGYTGCVYGQTPPAVNAVKAPGNWQSMDILFTPPQFDSAGRVCAPAYVTVFVNGIAVQNHTRLVGPTFHKRVTSYENAKGAEGFIAIQDHGNTPPLRFRNIWVRPLAQTDPAL